MNFLRKFIPNYAEIVKDIIDMLKKENEVKWSTKASFSFSQITKAISEAPILTSPNYSKLFSIFSFTSDTTIATILL